jgi:hypothetical protein
MPVLPLALLLDLEIGSGSGLLVITLIFPI